MFWSPKKVKGISICFLLNYKIEFLHVMDLGDMIWLG